MLDYSSTKKENAIEELLYDFLKNRCQEEMSEDVCETYLTIGMTPKNLQIYETNLVDYSQAVSSQYNLKINYYDKIRINYN